MCCISAESHIIKSNSVDRSVSSIGNMTLFIEMHHKYFSYALTSNCVVSVMATTYCTNLRDDFSRLCITCSFPIIMYDV